MKKIATLVVLLVCSSVFATLPQIPEDCFDDENYCYNYDVVENLEINKNVIRVNFIAQLDAGIYQDEQELLDRFLNFEAWGDYTQWLSEFNGNVKKALKEKPVVIDYCITAGTQMFEGKEVIINEANYWTQAPFPVFKLEVIERAFYFPIETYEGALFTWKFIADPSFEKAKGIQYKTGVLSVAYDEEEDFYYAYATIDVIPDMGFELALHAGAESVAVSLITVFSGMFE